MQHQGRIGILTFEALEEKRKHIETKYMTVKENCNATGEKKASERPATILSRPHYFKSAWDFTLSTVPAVLSHRSFITNIEPSRVVINTSIWM